MNKPIFTVSAKALVATHLFRLHDDAVPSCGIHIKPDGQGGSLICANNGYSCALIHDPFGECQEAVTITPSNSFIAAIKSVVKKPQPPIVQVSFDGERLSLLLDDCALMDQRDSCKYESAADYPNFLPIITRASEHVVSGYRGACLSIPFDSMKPFHGVAKLYGGDAQRALTLYPSGPSSPCLVRMDCNLDFVGLVMPMLVDETGGLVEAESVTCRDEPLKGFDSSVHL